MEGLSPLNRRVAGIDVHRMRHVVTVLIEQPDGSIAKHSLEFGGFKRDCRALAASVRNFRQFKSAAQFGAWLGLVPSQNSSDGKTSLGRITKRGVLASGRRFDAHHVSVKSEACAKTAPALAA